MVCGLECGCRPVVRGGVCVVGQGRAGKARGERNSGGRVSQASQVTPPPREWISSPQLNQAGERGSNAEKRKAGVAGRREGLLAARNREEQKTAVPKTTPRARGVACAASFDVSSRRPSSSVRSGSSCDSGVRLETSFSALNHSYW